MGVLGFVPFLQKTFPETIRTLPNRLKELSGRTLVFDGTLITQRLYFSPTPHPYRHVLGWYRMIKELKECDVQAICIFDGTQRTVAKKRETERRRVLRKLQVVRGQIEYDRLTRLRKVKSLVCTDQNYEIHKLEEAIQNFRSIACNTMNTPALMLPVDNSLTPERPAFIDDDPWGGMCELDLREVFSEPFGSSHNLITQISTAATLEDDVSSPLESIQGEIEQDAQQFAYHDEPSNVELPSSDPNDMSTTLASLYMDYRSSIPQLASLPASPPDVTEDDTATVNAMSKFQYKLAVDEGQFWENMDQLLQTDIEGRVIEGALEDLEQRSAYMSQSYERRNNPATAQTYAECKLILGAMGVPCIDSNGPFEAEAVASSIVINGYGDYVVSEDTDVLAYEAPLLRNITSRRNPLVVISGSEVRTVLSLDQSNYIDFLLLLGTDFSQRIKNVGPQRALKFIREHGSIEKIIQVETKYPPRLPLPSYLEEISAARHVFQTLPPVPDVETLEQKEMDADLVSELLLRFHLHRLVTNDSDYVSGMGVNYFGDDV